MRVGMVVNVVVVVDDEVGSDKRRRQLMDGDRIDNFILSDRMTMLISCYYVIWTYYYGLSKDYYCTSCQSFHCNRYTRINLQCCMQATCRKKQAHVIILQMRQNMRTLKAWTEMLPGYTYIYKKRKQNVKKRLGVTSQFCFVS
jgi:hypothetical protein